VHDFFPSLVKPTIEPSTHLEHQTLSSAYWTVRCGLVIVGSGHASPVDFASISLPTVGASAVGSPDSPVNFSRSALGDSREQRVRR
jgi:hypothetical protein